MMIMKILAIEDNPADAEILRELLADQQGSSFEIKNARSLAAAKSLVPGGKIDFILLDLGLPDSQGLDTLRVIRSLSSAIPIVVLTGFDDEETGVKALHEGAQDYLVKGQITGPSLSRCIRYTNERYRIDQDLIKKNEDLVAMNEEITAISEELRKNIEELSQREHELNDTLAEKEVLLSEIHHRVKNNLTAFISLLSLESAYDGSPAGLALKKDLQNRARSMALIHETLYRTKNYSRVNMDVYLSTLVGQIANSYESAKSIKTVVDAAGITLDLSRATPGGLIINELMTNSLKYAFPDSFDCEKVRGEPCTIEVSLTQDDGAYILTVRDNGIGLPGYLDIGTTKTLGLKLVNFLAKHQLRASIEIHSDKGAEFRFRFRDKK